MKKGFISKENEGNIFNDSLVLRVKKKKEKQEDKVRR